MSNMKVLSLVAILFVGVHISTVGSYETYENDCGVPINYDPYSYECTAHNVSNELCCHVTLTKPDGSTQRACSAEDPADWKTDAGRQSLVDWFKPYGTNIQFECDHVMKSDCGSSKPGNKYDCTGDNSKNPALCCHFSYFNSEGQSEFACSAESPLDWNDNRDDLRDYYQKIFPNSKINCDNTFVSDCGVLDPSNKYECTKNNHFSSNNVCCHVSFKRPDGRIQNSCTIEIYDEWINNDPSIREYYEQFGSNVSVDCNDSFVKECGRDTQNLLQVDDCTSSSFGENLCCYVSYQDKFGTNRRTCSIETLHNWNNNRQHITKFFSHTLLGSTPFLQCFSEFESDCGVSTPGQVADCTNNNNKDSLCCHVSYTAGKENVSVCSAEKKTEWMDDPQDITNYYTRFGVNPKVSCYNSFVSDCGSIHPFFINDCTNASTASSLCCHVSYDTPQGTVNVCSAETASDWKNDKEGIIDYYNRFGSNPTVNCLPETFVSDCGASSPREVGDCTVENKDNTKCCFVSYIQNGKNTTACTVETADDWFNDRRGVVNYYNQYGDNPRVDCATSFFQVSLFMFFLLAFIF